MGRQGAIQVGLELALEAVRTAYSDPTAATALAERARRTSPRDPEVAAVVGRALGMVAAARGDLGESVRRLRRTADAADRTGHAERAAMARGSLAYALVLRGRGAAALAELDRAQAVLSDGLDGARLRMQRGLVLSELRRVEEARSSLLEALRVVTSSGGDDLLEGDIRNNLAIVETARLDWPAVEEQLARAEDLFERSGMPGRTAMVWHNRATARSLRGDVPAALEAFDEADLRYRRAGMVTGLLSVERAEALLSAGLVDEARGVATTAVAEFRARGNRVDLVQAQVVLAEAMLLDADPGPARAEAAAARRAAVSQDRPGWAALAAFAELRAQEDRGVRPGALVDRGRRLAVDLAAAGWVPQSLDATLLVARAALASGRVEEARAALDSVRRARRRGPAAVRVRAWHAEALHRRGAGDQRGARTAVRAGLRVADEFRASMGATDLRAHAGLLAKGLAELGVHLALESGDPTAVLAATEAYRAAAVWLPPTAPADDDLLAADLAELRRLDADRRAGELAPQAGTARQLELERSVRDRARHAHGGRGAGRARLAVRGLRSALDDRVLVELLRLDGVVSAVVVSRSSVRLVRLGPADLVSGEVDTLLTGLRWLGQGITGTAVDLVARSAARLDAMLVGPCLEAARIGSAAPLVLVPGAWLSGLPWAALPSLAGRPFTVAPSAAAWLRACTAVPARDGSAGEATHPGRVLLAHGPGLPGAADEVRRLAAAYPGAEVLLGAEATVATVLARMDGADVVHLAAHGRLRVDNPMFSALELADGPLTVHDVERLHAAPRVVVLASCDAALGSVHPGDEVVGLANALLALGTRSVVAPVLPVPDEATSGLMTRLHDGLRRGSSPAAALATARDRGRQAPEPADVVTSAGFGCFGAG